MEVKITNKSKLTVKDMYNGFVLRRQWFTVSYQVFTFVFLFTLIIAIFFTNNEDQYLRILTSSVFLILSLSIGFLYPIFRALNWKNTLMKKSNTDSVEVTYFLNDVCLKASANVESYNFKLNYSEVERIKETKKYLMFITKDASFVICLKNGFASEKDIEKIKSLFNRNKKRK